MRQDFNNSPYNNDQINTILKDYRYPQPILKRNQKYVSFGENNETDVTALKPLLRNDAELQSATNTAYQIKNFNLSLDDTQSTKEVLIDYNQIPSGTNKQEQYPTSMLVNLLMLKIAIFLSHFKHTG